MTDDTARENAGSALHQFVEDFTQLLTARGFPRMSARVFGALLLAEDGRRSAAELAQLLQISPAAISAAVQNLIQVGLITRERLPGGRREVYRLFDDFWFETFAHQDRTLVQLQETLRDGIALVGEDSVAGARLKRTHRFFEYLHRELPPLVERWRRLEAEGE